jgi:hypothetical protein
LLQGTEVFEIANVVSDPGIRKQIDQFGTPEFRDKMRWAYLSRGPSRLIGHNFPKTKFVPDWRSFRDAWYTKYDWLEYSVEKMLHIVSIVSFSNLQVVIHNLDMMFSQSRGLKIGRDICKN